MSFRVAATRSFFGRWRRPMPNAGQFSRAIEAGPTRAIPHRPAKPALPTHCNETLLVTKLVSRIGKALSVNGLPGRRREARDGGRYSGIDSADMNHKLPMVLVSIVPFRPRRILFLAAAFSALPIATCFADSLLVTAKKTPYDHQMARIQPVLNAPTSLLSIPFCPVPC